MVHVLPPCVFSVYFRNVEKNVFRHSLYKKYNEYVPRYLWKRPQQVVSHCRASITEAEDITQKDDNALRGKVRHQKAKRKRML